MSIAEGSCLLNVLLIVVIISLLRQVDVLQDRLKRERTKIREVDKIINPGKYERRR